MVKDEACTLLHHSDYKIATNHWGLEHLRPEREKCDRCGLPSFDTWYRAINFDNRDPAYWKQIFKEAHERKAFYFKAEPHHGWAYGDVYVDADKDPISGLKPGGPPKNWANLSLIDEIRHRRYNYRLQERKEHDYGAYQPGIDRAIRKMVADLEYVDNTRFAAMDNRKDLKRYNKAKDKGCCGSVDYPILVKGRKFMIGCNYGH